MVIYYCC